MNDKNNKRNLAAKKRYKHEANNLGGYELLYPSENKEDTERYDKYLKEAHKIWEKFTGITKPNNDNKKHNTPKIVKKNTKCSTSTIANTNRTSKKSSVRLSFGRTVHSREK